MPKRRHVAKGKTGNGEAVVEGGKEKEIVCQFQTLEQTSPLLTLLYKSKIAQHAALSRIEAFYESHSDAQKYLTLDEAKKEKLCKHYEAFNFPIDAVKQWLECMKEAHAPLLETNNEEEDNESQVTPWWEDYCNAYENDLLDHLKQLGIFQKDDQGTDQSKNDPPVYVISTLSSKQAALQHERLHFLYFISSEYRARVQIEYQNLSTKSRKIIENDLNMKKYSSSVYIDEFQAYISEDAGEFGKSIFKECQEIQSTLKPLQRQLWKDLYPKAAV